MVELNRLHEVTPDLDVGDVIKVAPVSSSENLEASCHIVPKLACLLGDQSCNNVVLWPDPCIRRQGCARWICPEW